MNLAKKLTTLLNATLRGGLLPGSKGHDREFDSLEEQLRAIRQALAQVEIREREAADRLQETQARAAEAAARDDRREELAQKGLARELEAHLQTQSTEAIALSQKLAAMEDRLAEERERGQDRITSDQETTTKAEVAGGKTQEYVEGSPSLAEDELPPASDDDELATRKSRLSG